MRIFSHELPTSSVIHTCTKANHLRLNNEIYTHSVKYHTFVSGNALKAIKDVSETWVFQ